MNNEKIMPPALSEEAFCNSAMHICWQSDSLLKQHKSVFHEQKLPVILDTEVI